MWRHWPGRSWVGVYLWPSTAPIHSPLRCNLLYRTVPWLGIRIELDCTVLFELGYYHLWRPFVVLYGGRSCPVLSGRSVCLLACLSSVCPLSVLCRSVLSVVVFWPGRGEMTASSPRMGWEIQSSSPVQSSPVLWGVPAMINHPLSSTSSDTSS